MSDALCGGLEAPRPNERRELIAKALRLEWITLGWMLIEAAVAIGSGIIAHSLTLIAFGADSIIELVSAGVLIRRLVIEIGRGEAIAAEFERRAARIGSVLLFALSGYVVVAAAWSLWTRTGQEFSIIGLVLALVAIPLMFGLARAKAHIADRIGSRALRADAAEAIACGYLSAVVVVGLIAQGLIGAWWIDGLSALALTPFLFREALEAWEDDAG
jgi:divalent metal cation (Fe/Co/Zn/Cd) transporter